MIWHIFKKDVRLLWPLALSVLILQALCGALTWFLGYFDQPAQVAALTRNLSILVYLGIGVVGIAVAHQEPLSSVRADWLVRPISRRDLLLSKVLFMALMVNVPIMLVDVAQQLALHFALPVSIGVAASRTLALMVAFSLPALVLGAVTRSLTDALVFGVASVIAFTCLVAAAFAVQSPGQLAVHVTWIGYACAGLVMTLGAAATLAFQYTTRRALLARSMVLAVVLAVLCVFLGLPREFLIAIQDRVWGHSNDSEITLRFDPGGLSAVAEPDSPGLYTSPYVTASTKAAAAAEFEQGSEQIEQIRLPLRLSGMHANDILFADGVGVRITAMSGAALYQGSGACFRLSNGLGVGCLSDTLEIWAAPNLNSDMRIEQDLKLPLAAYGRLESQPVRLEITYNLTRFVRQPSQAIGAIGSVQPLREMGSCATRIDGDGDEVELWCLNNLGVPSCAAVLLEDPQTNTRNPELHMCNPNYAPFHRSGIEDAVGRSMLTIPFRDPSGLAHYPVDSAAIQRARIVVAAYDPVEHFHRTLVIPNIRLMEWALRGKTDAGPGP
jgi:hypothetical protein